MLAVTSLNDAMRRRIGSTNWVNAITITIAATWFGTRVPRPTPIAPHSAIARMPRPTSAHVSLVVEFGLEPEGGERRGARAHRGREGGRAEAGAHDDPGEELRPEHDRAARLGEEGGRERAVPDLARDRERAEEHREHVADRRREACRPAGRGTTPGGTVVLPPAAAAASGFSIVQPRKAPNPPARNAT